MATCYLKVRNRSKFQFFVCVKGKNCSENINECESNPCKKGGECIDLHGSYKCNCQYGYYGDNCEVSVVSFSRYVSSKEFLIKSFNSTKSL